MAPPKPEVPLKNHCSVVHDNTLYVYSPDAFQSIALTEDAEWKTLKSGVAATGAQCVYGGGALYIVGGTVDASQNYPGLMKYDFASKDWEWITPTDTITANRINHGATFLEASSQILIYAGSQVSGDTGSSSGTYTINTAAPYSVSSYPSGGAPNVVSPILLPWDDSTALMLGGGASQTQIYKFSVANGWENLGVQLPAPIADQTTTKCTLVDGDDGSKVLEQYNLGASPNEVTRLALLGAGGAQATTGQAVGAKKKRDLTLSDWPTYNSSLAPDTARAGASIAQDSKGRAIISGGDDDDPIAIFDERENTWMNATALFSGQEPTKVSSSSSSSLSSKTHSATSSASASPSLAAASSTVASAIASATASATGIASGSSSNSDEEHKNRMLTVLGATLGTIFGLAAVLIIILLLLRCKRNKNKGAGGEKGGEKDRLSFADRGVSQFGAYPNPPTSAPPYTQDNNASQTSLAIISGKFGNTAKAPKTHTRGLPSDASTAGLVKKQSPLAYNESHEMSPISAAPPYSVQNPMTQPPPAAVGDEKPNRSRSSGWSRYFANNEATNLASEPYDRSTYASNHSNRISGVSASEYDTNSRYLSEPPKFTHPSQALPPLDVSFTNTAFDGNKLSQVITNSPTIGNSREDLSSHGMGVGTPMRAELARANSVSTISSFESKRMSHTDGQQTWTPIEGSQWNNRAASSLYPDSRPTSEVQFADGTSSYYPNDGTSSYYPQDGTSSYYPKSNTNSLYPPSLHPDTAKMPAPPTGRESTVTVFPRGVPSTVPNDDERQKAIGNQDMSWLKF